MNLNVQIIKTIYIYTYCTHSICIPIKKNQIADNLEHVPLLVTPSSQKYDKQNASNFIKNNKVTNGNGFVDNNNSEQQQQQQRNHIRQSQISPTILSGNTSAQVMRSRLNQYRTHNVIVNFDENGTAETTAVGKDMKSKKKKKNSNYVADI